MEQKKILVIDDNTVNLATVEKALKGNFEVIPMISGKRALKYLYCQRVDLILLDVEMPEMDGVETLEEIRKVESSANTPVIFLTAKKDKQTVLDGVRLKIMDYITKPFDVESLTDRVEHVLKRAGQLPFEKIEIYRILEQMLNQIEHNDTKQALNRLAEAVHYKTEEEIVGRFMNAASKFVEGDEEGAVNVLRRLHKMLQMELSGELAAECELSTVQIRLKLNAIIIDLDNFKTKEATQKCKDFLKYDVSKSLKASVERCIELLASYDDEEAEKLLRETLANL